MTPHVPARSTTRRRAPGSARSAARRAALLVTGALALAGPLVAPPAPSAAQFADRGAVAAELATVDAVPLHFSGGIDAGETHSIGWTAAGELFAWGGDDHGELGLGGTTGRLRPQRVAFPDDVVVVGASAGVHLTIALTAAGDVYTWGRADVGDNTDRPRRLPPFTSAADPVVAVEAGDGFYLALTRGGALYSWGLADGRLGRAETDPHGAPARVTAQGLDTREVDDMSAGRDHGAAVVAGEVVLWGRFANHGLADGVTVTELVGDAVEVAAGRIRTSIRTAQGQVFAADGAPAWRITSLPAGVVGIATSTPSADHQSSFWAWDAGGVLHAWGGNAARQLGVESGDAWVGMPTPVAHVDGFPFLLASGSAHSLFGSTTGRLAGAGDNSHGQLGDGTTDPRISFEDVIEVVRWP